MTRGNQREIDRARAQARNKGKSGGEKREGNPQQRNESDAAKLAEKIARKKAQAEEQANGGGGGGGQQGGSKGKKK